MNTIQFRGSKHGNKRMVFVFDDQDVLRWSGPTLLEAMRFLAEWDQAQVAFDVDSAIWYLDETDAT